MFKSIVTPIDLDHAERADATLRRAKQLCDGDGKVTVVNVVADVPGLISAELPDGLLQESAHSARSKLLEMVKAAGITADVKILSGSPHRAIVNLAKEVDADLILMASHRPGIQDYLLGSTAASVVRHAHCAVLVER